jgi:7-cyano-7-deazaguanine synthase in queuosine biosynthesis
MTEASTVTPLPGLDGHPWYPAPAVCFDLDGTLTSDDGYPGLGEPDLAMLNLIERLHADGWWVLIATSRSPREHHVVESWLFRLNVPYRALYCGLKPPADVYVDDRSLLHKPRVLHALLEWRRRGTPDWCALLASGDCLTDFAYDIGIPVSGAPHVESRQQFGVVVPVTGGMDSTTLWAMAQEAGVPYHLVYVDMGQQYADQERATLFDLMPAEKVVHIDAPVAFETRDWTLQARNAVVMLTLADWMRSRDLWGEIWFGVTQGEMPVVGGDKSHRFLADMQHVLSCNGRDVRLVTPLAGWEKDDSARWWAVREPDLNTLRRTRSCFSGAPGRCGACVGCFRQATALLAVGVAPDTVNGMYEGGMTFGPVVDRYRERMAPDQYQRHGYSPHRCQLTLAMCDELECLGCT